MPGFVENSCLYLYACGSHRRLYRRHAVHRSALRRQNFLPVVCLSPGTGLSPYTQQAALSCTSLPLRDPVRSSVQSMLFRNGLCPRKHQCALYACPWIVRAFLPGSDSRVSDAKAELFRRSRRPVRPGMLHSPHSLCRVATYGLRRMGRSPDYGNGTVLPTSGSFGNGTFPVFSP